jgi:hypothetical protein
VSTHQQRETVRRAYKYRCGYCGVREEEAASELEIDHFQPRSADGGEDVANLVYCCTTCNRLKGDFWPVSESPSHRRLLHPQRDDLTAHMREEADGRLTPLTETGAFHLDRLRLNRAPLSALRRARLENAQTQQDLTELQTEQNQLREQLAARDEEIREILDQLARLLETNH